MLAWLPAAWATPTDVSAGSFVFLSPETACAANAQNCITTNAAAAGAAVDALVQAGGAFFLLPSLDRFDPQMLESAIASRHKTFLSFEEWASQAARSSGKFDCASYAANRIVPFLLPLKAAYPDAFYGFNLADEPGSSVHADLGQLRACLKQQPAFASMKIFVNLGPANANSAALNDYRSPKADILSPAEYGVDCSSNTIANRSLTNVVITNYGAYVRSAIKNIGPDILAFDNYPFTPAFDTCSAARELITSENMSNIAGIASVAYLQNMRTPPGVTPVRFDSAGFHALRWYSAWFFTFGGQGLANFLSHDASASVAGIPMQGMLSIDNTPRDLLNEQQSTFGMNSQVQANLQGYPFQDFVAPWLGVNTGTWKVVGASTNAITVSLGDFPGALYRLSSHP
ncbi:hypothetical protein [Burkholderia gladioli]|uniref:hypothetical protein n=1 Tax=Burkholderia gladioli TaxID=28095 RepID=UPI001641BF8F|nr:hypothetical protein [Burkholderia gladioli]